MALYFIGRLATDNSLFSPPLNSHFIEPVIFHTTSCTPGMLNKMGTPSPLDNCPKLH